MREYKFRAWDKTREQMINVDMLLNTENGMKQYRVTRPMVNGCLDVEFVKEDTILMQYTGLKDKNRVEIYEGDIVKITQHFAYSNNESFTALIDFEYFSFNAVLKSKGYETLDKLISLNHEFEVIGNIYENPELLN